MKTVGGREDGWNSAWTAYVGAPGVVANAPTAAGATTKAAWTASLTCEAGVATWANDAGPNETNPQNCLSWYDLYAFCIWDGGFLPSEAEWEYAATGGSEQRKYPWGNTEPQADAALAVYGCYFGGPGGCTGVKSIAPVGSVTAGAGRWNHLDLAGNAWEWTADAEDNLPASCNNCANLTSPYQREIRGGAYAYDVWKLPAGSRDWNSAANRLPTYGGRCARSP